MLNKTSISFLLVILAYSCSPNKQYVFNEWSHLNLKHKPKEILETYSFTPNSVLSLPDSLLEWWLEQPFKELLSYKTYSFNSNGFITDVKYHNSDFEPTNDSILGDFITNIYSRSDSIIIEQYSELLPDNRCARIYILNNEGLPIKKTVTLLDRTGWEDYYSRNNDNKIIKILTRTSGIDDNNTSTTELILNDLGDPIQEIKYQKALMSDFDDPQTVGDTVKYNYIYDKYNNWILRVELSNEKISRIVQRTISYH